MFSRVYLQIFVFIFGLNSFKCLSACVCVLVFMCLCFLYVELRRLAWGKHLLFSPTPSFSRSLSQHTSVLCVSLSLSLSEETHTSVLCVSLSLSLSEETHTSVLCVSLSLSEETHTSGRIRPLSGRQGRTFHRLTCSWSAHRLPAPLFSHPNILQPRTFPVLHLSSPASLQPSIPPALHPSF